MCHYAISVAAPAPNVVLVFADDLGYGDLGCFGSKMIRTPNLDRIAAEGVKLTDFYVAQAVCSASRAALLTGCYPNRIGIQGALGPASKVGISDGETTLGQLFRSKGYATAIYGKWHLGHHPQFLPLRHGFDDYYGLPYSNDMWPKHPTGTYPPLPLIDRDRQIEVNPDQRLLTKTYTAKAIEFVRKNKEHPFFLYLPHSMPHVPLHSSEAFAGRNPAGPYADVVEEIDASVGRILDAIRECGIDEKTLVIFTSDNGPWLSYGAHAGSSGPLREGKGTSFDGGVRVPFVARWPGQIGKGVVSRQPIMTIDLFPTLAKLIGAELPKHAIDGRDCWGVLRGEASATPGNEVLAIYWNRELQAVRSGKWKLHLPHAYQSLKTPGSDGKPGAYQTKRIEQSLFDLDADIGETTDLAARHPEVVAKLLGYAETVRGELGDSATKQVGRGVRPAGSIAP
ncbi:MAG: sulfatase [Gemmataceae bacterium]